MAYKVPSLESSTSFLVNFWKALFPKSNVGSRFSYHWKRLRAYAGGLTDLHAHVSTAQNDIMPDKATGTFLTRWGAIVGVAKKGATGASGAAALRVFGTPGKIIGAGYQLTHEATGFIFQTAGTGGTVGLPPFAYVDVDVQAISTGAATRLNTGETLKFTSPPDGITIAAKLVAPLTSGGYDAEQDSAYSVRVNDELAKPRMGGSQDDFVKWSLAYAGISAAYCYPNRAGVGTVDIAAFKSGDGTARILATKAEILAFQNYLKALAPSQVAGQGGSLRVLGTAADLQNVEVTLLTNGESAYEFDWDDSTPPTVVAYTPATRVLQLSSRPSSIAAGGRLCLKGVATIQDGAPFTIESLSSTDSVVLKETPKVNPAATDIVYAGGPLTAQIRDAVKAHMNGETVYGDRGKPLPASVAGSKVGLKPLALGIGPSNPSGTGTAAPTGLYGSWNGMLLRSELFKIAAYSTGVRNVTIVTPAADYAPTENVWPFDASVNFIAPQLVLVRKAW